ncbi:HAMP domain-containing methyl-accepting chemotaxis protein [Paenibacillus sp. FSL R7-0345]|uniref:methyl-accepting chemotaxis protein n=1 Tax=Paenibacillus sp. FSL R7-0345 TaxID=2954535 RepID=UPI003159D527
MRFLVNQKVSVKIMGLVGLSIVFMVLVGFTGYHYLNKINDNAKQMYHNYMVPNELISQIITGNAQINTLQLQLMIPSNQTAARQKEINDSIAAIITGSTAAQKEIEATGMPDDVKQLYDTFKGLLPGSTEARDLMLGRLAANQPAEAYTIYEKQLTPIRTEIMNTLDSIKELNQNSAAALNESNKKEASSSKIELFLLLAASLLVCGTVSIVLSCMITRPLNNLKSLMLDAQNGDLSVNGSYSSKDELGVLTTGFNEMITSLRGIIAKIGEHSQMLSVSSEELLASSVQTAEASSHIAEEIQDVADGSAAQLSSSRECSLAMDEVSTGIQKVSESVTDISGVTSYTTEQAIQGSAKITTVSGQLDTILSTSQASAAVVRKLDNYSQEIGAIVGLIRGIAQQTNLLALNASIEAARAGEHGRGFAVVAEEVRKLAEQSNQSSGQIASILSEIQTLAQEAVGMMDKESSEITLGLAGMQEAKETFEQIVSFIQEVNLQLEDVSAAAQQISASSEEVSASLQVTEEIAGSSFSKTQNVAAASEQQMATMKDVEGVVKSLSEMAEELQELSARFKV